MTERYYTRLFQARFIARCADLQGDEIALFTMAFMFMCERRGPISDDMQWLGRKAGVSTRRANQIRLKLIDAGKWHARDGMIADPMALEEFEYQTRRSAVARSNAMERWHNGTQPELDLKPGKTERKRQKTANSDHANASPAPEDGGEMRTGEKSGEKPGKNARTNAFISENSDPEMAENGHSDPDFALPNARARVRDIDKNQTNESESSEPRAAVRSLGRATDDDLLGAVLEASGFVPSSPEARADALERVKGWREDGIDFERTVIPAVLAEIAKDDDPTSSLKRFERAVRHRHAKGRAAPATSSPVPKPPPPPPEPDDEDPRLSAVRSAMRERFGARTYDGWIKPCRFGIEEPSTLLLEAPGHFLADWIHTHLGQPVTTLISAHGLTNLRILVNPPKQGGNTRP